MRLGMKGGAHFLRVNPDDPDEKAIQLAHIAALQEDADRDMRRMGRTASIAEMRPGILSRTRSRMVDDRMLEEAWNANRTFDKAKAFREVGKVSHRFRNVGIVVGGGALLWELNNMAKNRSASSRNGPAPGGTQGIYGPTSNY